MTEAKIKTTSNVTIRMPKKLCAAAREYKIPIAATARKAIRSAVYRKKRKERSECAETKTFTHPDMGKTIDKDQTVLPAEVILDRVIADLEMKKERDCDHDA